MNLRPERIERNIEKRQRRNALESLNLPPETSTNVETVVKTDNRLGIYDDIKLADNSSDYNFEDNESEYDFKNNEISNFITEDLEFDILCECDQLISDKCGVQNYPNDSSNIAGYGPSVITKLEYSQQLNNIILKYQIPPDAVLEILLLTKSIAPSVNLPFHETVHGNNRLDIKKYICDTNSSIHIDVCEAECMIFIGNNKHRLYCSECNTKRYYDCTETSCKNKSYELCNHSNRRPRKTIIYRPIIPLLAQLLSYEFFLDALNYKYCKPDFESNKYEYMDVLDGSNAKEALAEMKGIFEEKNLNETHIPVNLLFGIFYDGIQLYHTKTVHFWPCFLTILNLPPSMRNEIGVGMFLCTIYTGLMGSPPERFIIEHCVIKEFLSLRQGLSWCINGKYYFVQARLIHHFLDTKALGQELNVQKTGSYAGCPLCPYGKGHFRRGINHITYGNFRKFLSPSHFLRTRGNSMQCCPREYWRGKETFNTPTTTNVSQLNTKIMNLNELPRVLNFKTKIVSCNPDDEQKAAIDYFRLASNLNNSAPYDWYHDETFHNKNDFSSYLHYPHGLISSKIKLRRNTQKEFKENGVLALQERKVVNGVKGLWPFSVICDVEKHVEFDPFHSVSGICLNYLLILKGKRLTDTKKAFCLEYNVQPFMFPKHFVKANVPYIVNEKSQRIIDACVAGILIPFGHSKHFQIHNIFSETGNLRGKDKIRIFMILIPFLNLFWNIQDAYKSYFKMFSADLVDLYSFNMSCFDIDHLCEKILETCAVHEGLFTETECTMLLHELIHLPQHIRRMGTVCNFHTLFGERAVKTVKSFRSNGGKSFYLQIADDYDKWESCKTSKYYENAFKNRKDSVLNMIDNQLQYNEYIIRVCSKINITNSNKLEFSPAEMNSLALAVVSEVYKIFHNEDEALNSSPIYRLYVSYKQHKQKFKLDFFYWLEYIHSLFISGINTWPIFKGNVTLLCDLDYYIQGCIYSIDTHAAKSLTSVAELSFFKHAIINGDKFTGRGVECKEPLPVHKNWFGTQFKSNTLNDLSKVQNWKKYSHSSFVRYRACKTTFSSDFGKDFHGHLNFFSVSMYLKINSCMGHQWLT